MTENFYRLIQNLQSWYNGRKQTVLIRKDLMHPFSNADKCTQHSAN